MGLGSILLGVFALVCMFGGFVLTLVPFLGTMLSFLAPVLALAGIVLGGVAMSRAKEAGESEGLAVAGLVVNIIAFIPAMLVAVTCGLCNTMITGCAVTPTDPNQPAWWLRDSGPSPFDQLFRDAGTASVGAAQPGDPQGTPGYQPPPPAFPPPPLAPTPTDPVAPTEPTPTDPATPTEPTEVEPAPIEPSVTAPPSTLPAPPLPAGPRPHTSNTAGATP